MSSTASHKRCSRPSAVDKHEDVVKIATVLSQCTNFESSLSHAHYTECVNPTSFHQWCSDQAKTVSAVLRT